MDEIHRFNKKQQDIFLPSIESGKLILIGATTENPSFSLNKVQKSGLFFTFRRSFRAVASSNCSR